MSEPRVIIWTPFGRDATLAKQTLNAAAIASEICTGINEASRAIGEETAGAALLAEEALDSGSIDRLRHALDNQARWSDLPIILLTGGGNSTHASLYRLRLMRVLGNITLLERPLRGVTLVTAVQGALRSRAKQFEVRDYLQKQAEMQAKLEQANTDLKQFAFAASHDLQEPLRAVKIFSRLLLDRIISSDDKKAQDYADFVDKGVSRMETLLRDLLRYSRAVHEDAPDSHEEFRLSRALEKAVDTLRIEIEESKAVLNVGRMCWVRGDETQVSLVFQNLLGNAVRYRNPKVSLVVSVSCEEQQGMALVQIRDNGIGFEPKYAERIFELFQRLSNSSATGTGLGLALSRRIIERHGGRIWAESQPDVGSIFSFTLPLGNERDE